MLAKNETYGGMCWDPRAVQQNQDVLAVKQAYQAIQESTRAYDKNTPESLKQLRWAVYETIDNYQGDYGKTIAGCLKQEVERLFKEYTNS